MSEGHRVTVRSGGLAIANWNSYSVKCDMLDPADDFQLALGPADPVTTAGRLNAFLGGGDDFAEAWHAVAPDSPVEILLDDVVIMSGFIDERTGSSASGGDTIVVSGRDKCGRLLDESAPIDLKFSGLTIEQLALKIASPWFEKVSFSNAENRALALGIGRGAKGGRALGKKKRAPRGSKKPKYYRKVEPGETRWAVLEYFMHENDLLAWGAADGRTLIIGEPDYDQEPTFHFFHGRAQSERAREGNCESFTVRDSVAERYSQIIAMGASTARPVEAKLPGAYDPAVAKARVLVKHNAGATDGPGPFGVGRDFKQRKVLIVPDDAIKSNEQAGIRAVREMAERDATGHEITLTVEGHSQHLEGARAPSLYACDTMARVESEVFGIRGLYLITSVRFTRSREEAKTEITLVPKGTLLRA
jgi:prophage tail gpP-like protein